MKNKNLKTIQKERCKVCGVVAEGIARTYTLCRKHFSIIQRDNAYKFNIDMEIPQDLIFFKRCYFYRCSKKFIRNLTETESIEFCSEKCKKLETINRTYYDKK